MKRVICIKAAPNNPDGSYRFNCARNGIPSLKKDEIPREIFLAGIRRSPRFDAKCHPEGN